MDSLIFELQIVFYFQLFLSANVRHSQKAKRGMKKPTQPTIAHDETHEVGELSQWRQKLPKQKILSLNWKDI